MAVHANRETIVASEGNAIIQYTDVPTVNSGSFRGFGIFNQSQ